mmetsp:Transcript_11095/g.18606  ORF Transcript_11095/g.18606 Transcript_11095/m.18606 type:complete len:123 (+) Transcript_11095:1235-1603(+)
MIDDQSSSAHENPLFQTFQVKNNLSRIGNSTDKKAGGVSSHQFSNQKVNFRMPSINNSLSLQASANELATLPKMNQAPQNKNPSSLKTSNPLPKFIQSNIHANLCSDLIPVNLVDQPLFNPA